MYAAPVVAISSPFPRPLLSDDLPEGASPAAAGASEASSASAAAAREAHEASLSSIPLPLPAGVPAESAELLGVSDPSGKASSMPASVGRSEQPLPVIPEFKEGSTLWRIRGMIKTLRPNQWVKNFFVLAPIVFAKELTSPALFAEAATAFGVFCMLSGAVYTMNDIVDAPADRVHPVKRRRPIASGRVPVPLAKGMLAGLVVAAFTSAAFLPLSFFVVAALYFAQNVAYSFGLKKVAYVDVSCISLGFVLRVLAGGFATHTKVSVYMLACTALLALFLGFGKRRHELASSNASKQRSALGAYDPRVLTAALAITGVASVGGYLAYTRDLETERYFNTPWLWITTVHPLFGVIRFLQLVAGRPKAESPTQEMLRDVPFVLNIVLWVIEVIAIVYQVRFS
jgi:decaprenyl-phosphate phosphoribosyltransferase